MRLLRQTMWPLCPRRTLPGSMLPLRLLKDPHYTPSIRVMPCGSSSAWHTSATIGRWAMASGEWLHDRPSRISRSPNGLPADDTWDSAVEEAMNRHDAIPASETPFGEWIQPGTSCGDPNNPRRLVISSKNVTAGVSTCLFDQPLQRSRDGWRTIGSCSRGSASAAAHVHFQLINGRLVDRSTVGNDINEKPAMFSRCM